MTTWLPGFVEGVFVEVLWDLERVTIAGRREGETISESVWWRGEVIEVGIHEGRILAKIKYDSMGDFESEVGEVRVFPRHVQLIDKNDRTQLRWRYYESSGEVRYETLSGEHEDGPQDLGYTASFGEERSVLRLSAVQNQMEELKGRVDQIERLAVSQKDIFSRIMESELHGERCIERLFALLRQKLATVVQKPLLFYKRSEGHNGTDTLFDLSCTGSIRSSVDCSIEEFEHVCRAVRSLSESAHFRVDGRPLTPFSTSLRASVAVAEVLFESLSGLCEALGICDEKDILNIAQRERRVAKKGNSEDAAVRFAGTFLVDSEADDTPPAILVCHGVHDGMSAEKSVDVLTRLNRDLDPRTVWYNHPLQIETMTVSCLLHRVYPNECIAPHGVRCEEKFITKNTDVSCFALRWKPLSNPSSKEWSRKMIMSPDSTGTLEVEIPYVLIRGTKAVNEMKDLVTASFVKKQLS